jgi:hypothetical protein
MLRPFLIVLIISKQRTEDKGKVIVILGRNRSPLTFQLSALSLFFSFEPSALSFILRAFHQIFDNIQHGRLQRPPLGVNRLVLAPAEVDDIEFLTNHMFLLLAVDGLGIILDKHHPIRLDAELSGNSGGNMTAAAADRHPAIGNVRGNNDIRPQMRQSSLVTLFKIEYSQPALSTGQAQYSPKPFPGINVIIN